MAETPILRLPTGMRDHAPEAASARRRIVDGLLATFERHGFARVITPAFEYEDVLALGLGRRGARGDGALRRAELGRGGRAAPRHHAADRAADRDALPRRAGARCGCATRGRSSASSAARAGQRELMQAGVELAGVPGPDGDADAIALAVEALAAVGLRRADDRSRPPRARARGAVGAGAARRGARRGAPLHRQARRRRAGRRPASRRAARRPRSTSRVCCPSCRARPTVLDAARAQGAERAASSARWPSWPRSSRPFGGRKLDARLHVDLGEVRGFDYYTGVRFQAFVAGARQRRAAGRPLRRPAGALRAPEPGGRFRRRRRRRGRARWNRSHEKAKE